MAAFPFALTASCLKAWLANYDISVSAIGAFSFMSLPYSLRFLWAPFVDYFELPYLSKTYGRVKAWLIFSQLVLIISCTAIAIVNPSSELLLFTILAFIISVSSATLNISLDAYRISKISDYNQAEFNKAIEYYSYGYRLGMYGSGVGVMFAADLLNWQAAYLIASLVMLLFMISIINTPIEKTKDNKPASFFGSLTDAYKNIISKNGAYYAILIIVTYKLCDALPSSLSSVFLIRLGYSPSEIALYVKIVGFVASLLGTAFSGLITKKVNMQLLLFYGMILQIVSNLVYIGQVYVGHNILFLATSTSIESFTGAVGDMAIIIFLNRICDLRFAAVQYSILQAIAFSSRNIFAGFAGVIVDAFGWSNFFVFTMLIGLPSLWFIFKLNKNYVKINSD